MNFALFILISFYNMESVRSGMDKSYELSLQLSMKRVFRDCIEHMIIAMAQIFQYNFDYNQFLNFTYIFLKIQQNLAIHTMSSFLRNSNKKQDSIIDTIDQILTHHYFHQKLSQILEHNKISNKYDSGDQLTDQYYRSQDEIITEISTAMDQIMSQRVRIILNEQFINVNEQVTAMKQEIYKFTNEQHKLTQNLKKEVFRVGDQLRRKSLVTNVVSSSSNYTGNTSSGIRFLRSSARNLGQQPETENKSYHSQLIAIRKQIQDLKKSIEESESISILRNQFNQYKMQSKIKIQSVVQKQRKIEIQSSSSKNILDKLIPNLKENIDQSVKRSLKSMLKVYGTYAEQISKIRQDLEKLTDDITKGDQQSMQYFSSQLKSVWMIINDLKRNVDSIVERNNLDMSMQIL